jgi:hypothetical protein
MAVYTRRSFASNGRIVAVQRLSAEDDEEALAMACEMVKGASAVAGFDLWQGERRIEGEAPAVTGHEGPRGGRSNRIHNYFLPHPAQSVGKLYIRTL